MSDNNVNGCVESSSTFSFKWKVKQFSEYLKTDENDLESPELLTIYGNNLLHWRLRLSKNDDREGYESFLAVYLDYKEELPLTVSAIFAFLRSVNQQRVFQRVSKAKFNNKNLKYCGIVDFVQKSLITDGYMDLLINDSITVTCEIRFQDFIPCVDINSLSSQFCRLDVTEKSTIVDDLTCLSDDFNKLLESEKYSDVSFTVGDKKLGAHKNILVSRSSVFAKMFADHNDVVKKHSLVPLKDVSFDVMQEVLRYVYTGKVGDKETMAVELLVAAEKYELTRLKTICEKILIDKLKFDNAFDLLLIAKTFNATMLKVEVMDFIISRLEEYVKTNEFNELNVAIKNDLLNALSKRNT